MDIILLQEHWLHGYEKEEITSNLEGWQAVARSVDDEDHPNLIARTQGYGGVAVLWKEHLNPYISSRDEGNNRILPIFFESGSDKLCILNCYLPSGNSADAVDKFCSDLSIIQALMEKYNATHTIILSGDLNADIINRNTKKERKLLALVRLFNLKIGNKAVSKEYTFKHKSMEGVTSHLDYFITSQEVTLRLEVAEECPINTSAHKPVMASIQLRDCLSLRRPSAKEPDVVKKTVKWMEGDVMKYQESIAEALYESDLNLKSVEEAILDLESIILQAEETSFPVKRSRTRQKQRRPFYPELAEAVGASKMAHHRWKEAGRPPQEHPLTIERRKASNMVRRVQRQHEAEKRHKLYDDILDAHEKDQSTFFRLLKRKHGAQAEQIALRINGKLSYDSDVQREEWAKYYKQLATPDIEEEFSAVMEAIRDDAKKIEIRHITEDQTSNAIRRLNSGKTADIQGLQAEHFKFGGGVLAEATTRILNRIIEDGKIPESLKTGFKIPIPKKGKDILEMGNHRGITITPTLGKILEHILQDISKPELGSQQSSLQFGFTAGRSPTMTSLCLTEAAAQAKDLNQHLYVATLDAQKAFDVVSHEKLKIKLHHTGIRGNNWILMDSLYTDCSEVVRWQGSYSQKYEVQQGVRQGGVLSTSLYKEYINPLLVDCERSDQGIRIGSIYLGVPTCADDVLLLSNSKLELQSMLDDAFSYATENSYKIHPSKSTVTQLIGPATEQLELALGNERITNTESFVHLGMTWTQGSSSPSTDEKISLGRRTAYMLIGSGIHGTDGLNPIISLHIMKTQILPRMTHGIEATLIKCSEMKKMNKAYKDLLRQQQTLPERVATEAIFLLVGGYPAEAYIEYKTLILFGAILRLGKENPLFHLARRQLSLPDSSHSWFVRIRSLSLKYEIDVMSALDSPWSSQGWKKYVREIVFGYYHTQLVAGASQKSSLKWLDLSLCRKDTPHPVWSTCTYDRRETMKAAIRVKLLAGTYVLQTTLLKFGKSKSGTCLLCDEEEEDTVHFLARCKSLEEERFRWKSEIDYFLLQAKVPVQSAEDWVKLVVNGGSGGVLNVFNNGQWWCDFNRLCNRFLSNLHISRDQKINDILLRKEGGS